LRVGRDPREVGIEIARFETRHAREREHLSRARVEHDPRRPRIGGERVVKRTLHRGVDRGDDGRAANGGNGLTAVDEAPDLGERIVRDRMRRELGIECRFDSGRAVARRGVTDGVGGRRAERIEAPVRRRTREDRAVAGQDLAAVRREERGPWIVRVLRETRPLHEPHVELPNDQQGVGNEEDRDDAPDRAIDVHLRTTRKELRLRRSAGVRAAR
jgi:hypothetical protein